MNADLHKNTEPTFERALFYFGYALTMLVLIGSLFLIWELNVLPVFKFLLLLPLIYIGTLLTLSI